MTAFADLFAEHRAARRQLRRMTTVRGAGPAIPAFRRAAARYAKAAAELVDEWHRVSVRLPPHPFVKSGSPHDLFKIVR
jgi:hypothetical protein